MASWAAFKDAALPAPSVARTRPGTYLELIGKISAMPHAAAGITAAFSTTIAATSTTRCSGATSSRTVKVMPSDKTVAPTEMAMPALNSAVSSWSAVTPAPSAAKRSRRRGGRPQCGSARMPRIRTDLCCHVAVERLLAGP